MMNQKLRKILDGQCGNYIFPFLWLHGEDEETLRNYMRIIYEANLRAVCVESRPHPDFCGSKWWADMDIILDEAQKRNMQVWILDDAHFPTGYANGAVVAEPDEKHRQVVCCKKWECQGKREIMLEEEEVVSPPLFEATEIEKMLAQMNGQDYDRRYEDDRFLGVFAVNMKEKNGDIINLTERICSHRLQFTVPDGTWRIYGLYLTRNAGFHRNYINMLDEESCRILLDAVYEPHYTHYGKYFGNVIAGFFSDEPELGNGHLYDPNAVLGVVENLPWSRKLEERLKERWGNAYPANLIWLWENEGESNRRAKARYDYMDEMTKLVKECFSMQIGDWCRERHVKYIGHMIEDNQQHARTGTSLGHYFRALAGQDMAGIDNIGGQVLPQGENLDYDHGPFSMRQGEFYHYMLGTLGTSLASIDPLKEGKSMCEIFGNYGWTEGVRLEKYLVDHFLARGINHYVPHAFSAKEFPDPDCPPHFYANGNNPQYRHFGELMGYTNRVCELISDGIHETEAAVLYHAESEWVSGKSCMYSSKIGRILAETQIEYDYIPQDVFQDTEKYCTQLKDGKLVVNTQQYKIVIVPAMEYITGECAKWLCMLYGQGVKVYFVDRYPLGYIGGTRTVPLDKLKQIPVMNREDLKKELYGSTNILKRIEPENRFIRTYHYKYQDGSRVCLLVNEGTEVYSGNFYFESAGNCCLYDAWANEIYPAQSTGNCIPILLEPLKSLVLFDDRTKETEEIHYGRYISLEDRCEIKVLDQWKRSICRSIDYPSFSEETEVVLPDKLAEEKPGFSGFVRYETRLTYTMGKKAFMEITDAHEGVEVFVNGKSLGIQIAPPFRYELTSYLCSGENIIAIEVATTLEREMAKLPNEWGQQTIPTALSGITGEIHFVESKI